ncbi:Stk1 family PASTA domain-containing Ser/Thr kinase [Corynebacterium canis]|uniref:non-specific serine/threonine protein kinase n=1 Tax=Corynebacterium canis TaxID=679663 RepID=A0A5C5UEU0_9CORY|nr:Stk1 family PASTA domain-containing Ser/Thr kinase [Corynebacterium canis]TWT23905.1 Stk1 family PASTA domain-containing Ser/Thr kinase [Corynebacterium canis]WJY73889.1 Serine/threonine-protein kinase PknB [Corynebacterium canis]
MSAQLLSNRYELGSIIGSGGMSDVYAATDTLLGRPVAVKMMRLELARDTTFKERFRREAQNSGRLNHPAIVSIYDTGETEIQGTAVPYIVMELVHGRTLRDIVIEDGPLAPADAAKVLVPVCEALAVSHEAGIVHRDIKPANIMITNTGAVKVMDFGIARAFTDASSAMTQTATVIGTAQYLSPEQARGKNTDPRSDIYSLGCVFYEIVAGRPPFEGETAFAVAYQHVQDTAPPPSEFIPGLSPTMATNVNAVALTAMAKNPADRYQTAMELAEDFSRVSRNAVARAAQAHLTSALPMNPVMAGAPTTIGTPPDLSITPQPGEIPPVMLPEEQALMASAPTQHLAPTAAESEEPAKRSKAWIMWLASIVTVIVLGVAGVFAYDYVTGSGISASNKVSIPRVSGISEAAAVKRLEEAGFKVSVETKTDPEVPRGSVISTDPDAGTQVTQGSEVVLFVSSGKEVTEVPDVTGKKADEAKKILEKADLKLDDTIKEAPSDSVPEGEIVEMSPSAGSQVTKGTTITVTVSTGIAMVRIPVISGSRWATAESNLTSMEFIPHVEYIDSSEPEGTVISVTGPAGEQEGTQTSKGAELTVQVSNGRALTTPNLVGMNVGQAIGALRAAGWEGPDSNLTQERVDTNSLIDQGKIAHQSPAPGTPLPKNGKVTVGVFIFNLLGGN